VWGRPWGYQTAPANVNVELGQDEAARRAGALLCSIHRWMQSMRLSPACCRQRPALHAVRRTALSVIMDGYALNHPTRALAAFLSRAWPRPGHATSLNTDSLRTGRARIADPLRARARPLALVKVPEPCPLPHCTLPGQPAPVLPQNPLHPPPTVAQRSAFDFVAPTPPPTRCVCSERAVKSGPSYLVCQPHSPHPGVALLYSAALPVPSWPLRLVFLLPHTLLPPLIDSHWVFMRRPPLAPELQHGHTLRSPDVP
jgi:hypothetical protein